MAVVLPVVVSTFGIVFVAELPDKTALASLLLATRYPARQVIAGAWLAFVVQTLVAVLAGSVLRLLPAQFVHVAAGTSFLVFAVLALRRTPSGDVPKKSNMRVAPWLATFVVVFVAEWADLTQLASAAIVAMTGQPLSVAIGAIAALWLVTVFVSIAGSRLGSALTPSVLNRASAALMAGVGVFVLASAARSILAA